METSTSRLRVSRESGFTLVETMVAIVVLATGLMGIAALMSQMNSTSYRSRYMSMAAVLATEKLEDLNKYPSDDANVAAGGSLTADVVGYYDTIQLSSGDGAIAETIQGTTNGQPTYTTTTHLPDGTITTPAATAAPPAPGADTVVLDRRWLIAADQPVAGVRRVTVFVSLTSPAQSKKVSFQSSMVRP
jgi:prepilin-type N-terminal cleavage/methylation domain-containing protein